MSEIVRIYLVDTSGSMDGPKKEFVCSMVEKEKVDHLFAFGDSIRAELKPSELRSFPFDDGTKIQVCLLDMFSRLQRMSGSKKDFVFITDAEDTLSDVPGTKRAWQQCQEFHEKQNGKITGMPIFVGEKSGGCVAELKQVFESVEVITPEDIAAFMEKVRKVQGIMLKYQRELSVISTSIQNIDLKTAEAEELLVNAKISVDNLSREIESFEQEIKKLDEEKKNIEDIIKKMETQSKQTELRRQFDDAKTEYLKLESLQNEALENSETILAKIEQENVKLTKIKGEVDKEQANANKAEDNASECMKEVGKLKDKISDLRSQLATANDKSTEHISEQIKKLSSEILSKTRKLAGQFKEVNVVQVNLNEVNLKLVNGQKALDERKTCIYDMTDIIFKFVSSIKN